MTFRGMIVAFGILGFCSLGCFAVNCYSKSSMQYEQQRCFEKYGLELNVGSDGSIHSAMQNDPGTVCREQDSYNRAMQCALNMSRNCMVTLGQNPDILPDARKVAYGVSYMCEHADDINSQCVKNQNEDVKQCAMRKALAYFSENPTQNITVITCKAFKIAEECSQEELSVCGSETVNIMVHLTNKYITPPACATPGGSDYAYTTMAPMTTAELMTGVPSLPDVSCYSQSSIQRGQEECFQREGITVELPDLNLEGGKQEVKQSYLDALLSNSKDFHAVCRKLRQYQRGMGCAMEVARNCMPAGYKDYLPNARQIQLMLGELCEHVEDINQPCVRSKASALFDCGYRMGMQHRTSDVKALLCNAFKFNTKCQKEVLPACGCKTTRLYVSIAKKYLNPTACSPNEDTVPVCHHENSDQFAYSYHDDNEYRGTGGATQNVASASFLATAAVLVSLVFV